MAENPSTSSEANPNPLPTKEDFLSAERFDDAFEILVKTYNGSVEPEYYLNWENVQGIFGTTEKSHQIFSKKDRKARSEQSKSDFNDVTRYVTSARRLEKSEEQSVDQRSINELADLVLCQLDNAGIIKIPNRSWGTGLQPEFPKDTRRAFAAYC